MKLKSIAVFVFLVVALFPTAGQAYIDDLNRGDISAFQKKIKLLDIDIKATPLVATYLSYSNVRPDILAELIKMGANVSLPYQGKYPLYYPIFRRDDPSIVSMLLDASSPIDFPISGSWGSGIIDFAIANDAQAAAILLIKKNASLPATKRLKVSPSYQAFVDVALDDVKATKQDIANGRISENTVLHFALYAKSAQVLALLAALDIRLSLEDTDSSMLQQERTYIVLLSANGIKAADASSREWSDLFDFYLTRQDDEVLDALFAMGASPSSKSIEAVFLKDPEEVAKYHGEQEIKANSIHYWELALQRNDVETYKYLIRLVGSPKATFEKAAQLGDEYSAALIVAGFQINPHEIDWNALIRKGNTETINAMLAHGNKIPRQSAFFALAYGNLADASAIEGAESITTTELQKAMVPIDAYTANKYLDRQRLAVNEIVKAGNIGLLKNLQDTYHIFETNLSSAVAMQYHLDRSGCIDQQLDSKALRYFNNRKEIQSSDDQDRENLYFCNNYNSLVFVMALKYGQFDIAKYIYSIDAKVADIPVFTPDIMNGPSSETYYFTLQDFARKVYKIPSLASFTTGK